jgi:hypothetical protein
MHSDSTFGQYEDEENKVNTIYIKKTVMKKDFDSSLVCQTLDEKLHRVWPICGKDTEVTEPGWKRIQAIKRKIEGRITQMFFEI